VGGDLTRYYDEGAVIMSGDTKLDAYRDAWVKLQADVLDEKTGWGKEELKKRMDKLLIECMEAYL